MVMPNERLLFNNILVTAAQIKDILNHNLISHSVGN